MGLGLNLTATAKGACNSFRAMHTDFCVSLCSL